MTGKRDMGDDVARKLEQAYQFELGWMDQPHPDVDKDRSIEVDCKSLVTGPAIKGYFPLISWVQAGKWREIEGQLGAADAEDWLPCAKPCSARTFVLRVQGDSMDDGTKRAIHDGDLIFVDPEREALHGKIVIARLSNQDAAICKELIVESDKAYLKARNPRWPQPYIEIDENIEIIGVVFLTSRDM